MHRRFAATCILALSSAWAHATTDYDRIQNSDILEGAIGMGMFARDLPLPPGRWQVLQATDESVPLTPKSPSSSALNPSVPMYAFTLRNTDNSSPLAALILRFTPRASNVDWLNTPCVSSDPARELVDSLGITSTQATLFGCVRAGSITGLHRDLKTTIASNIAWVNRNLRPYAPYVDQFPDQAVVVTAYANQYLGRNFAYAFVVRQEQSLQTPSYANHIRNWMNSVGRAMLDIASNRKTELPLPTAYYRPAVEEVPPIQAPANAVQQRVPLDQIHIQDDFAREAVAGDNYTTALHRCIPQFRADSPGLRTDSLTRTATFTVTFSLPPQSNFFLLQPGTQGACVQGSEAGYPILPGAAIRETLEIQGPPLPVAQDWYRRIAMNIAKHGETTVAFAHPDGSATIARLVVSLRSPLGFRHVHYLRKAGSWEDLEIDDKFVHPAFSGLRTSVKAGSGEGFSQVSL